MLLHTLGALACVVSVFLHPQAPDRLAVFNSPDLPGAQQRILQRDEASGPMFTVQQSHNHWLKIHESTKLDDGDWQRNILNVWAPPHSMATYLSDRSGNRIALHTSPSTTSPTQHTITLHKMERRLATVLSCQSEWLELELPTPVRQSGWVHAKHTCANPNTTCP